MKKILLTIMFITQFCYSKILIWDFGGIIFNPDKLGVAKEIGLHNFILYMIGDLQNPNIQKNLFNFLHQIMPMENNKHYIPAQTADQMQLPIIMCHWQAGTIKGPDIIKICHKYISKFSKIGYFKSKREENLIKKTIEAMFNPDILANNVYPIEEGVNLLRDCAKARNFDGTKKNINIGFSNWDPLSFEKFYKKNLDAFAYFDHILISGHIGLIKPDKKAYEYLLKKFDLDPKNCILIDDQKINGLGAKKCGIKSILLKNWNYTLLRTKLRKLGVL